MFMRRPVKTSVVIVALGVLILLGENLSEKVQAIGLDNV